MLDLVRLSRETVFPPGGEDLYRRIAQLTDLVPENEVLDAACGRGVSTLYLARTFGVSGVGIDSDRVLVQEAYARARDGEMEGRISFETAPLDDLPFSWGPPAANTPTATPIDSVGAREVAEYVSGLREQTVNVYQTADGLETTLTANGDGTPPCSWMIVLSVNLLMS